MVRNVSGNDERPRIIREEARRLFEQEIIYQEECELRARIIYDELLRAIHAASMNIQCFQINRKSGWHRLKDRIKNVRK
jgi:hypothetical protein